MNEQLPDLNSQTQFWDKVQKTTPKSKNYARFLLVLRIGGVVLAGILSIFFLSSWLIDLLENIEVLGVDYIRFLPLQVLVVFALLIGSIYFIYRQTDWPIVQHTWLILGITVGFSLIIGGLLAYASYQNFIPAKDVIQQGGQFEFVPPGGGLRKDRIKEFLADKNEFGGLVVMIDKDDQKTYITVENRELRETKTFYTKDNSLKIDRNVPIQLRYKSTSDGLEIEEIKSPPKIPRPPMNKQDRVGIILERLPVG